MPRPKERSRVELVSDGTRLGTHVYLVIEDTDGHEVKYKIPNVLSAEYQIGGIEGKRDKGVLMLLLGGPLVRTSVAIGPGRSTIEDLLSEIAATKLSNDRRDD